MIHLNHIMKAILLLTLLACVFAEEMLVTREYTDYLKKHVTWEVMDYEDNVFRGWTVEEAQMFLGAIQPEETEYVQPIDVVANMPSKLNWAGADCDHGVKNQGNCGSCWAFATTGMLSDRCCMQGHDNGWLAPQELVSCDKKSKGCSGGWCTWALDYVKTVNGMVKEACFPYKASNAACPTKCADGSDWKGAHVCACPSYKTCVGVESVKSCLQKGPVTLAFGVCRSFMNYKSGVYKCDCGGSYLGLHAVLGMGYSDEGAAHYVVRNSWGTSWGMSGYFHIGVNECGISGTYPNGNVACETVG